jgi:hypothetical protein
MKSLLACLYEATFTNVTTGQTHNAPQQLTQREIEANNAQLAADGVNDFRWIAEMPSTSTNSADTERDAINSIDWNS